MTLNVRQLSLRTLPVCQFYLVCSFTNGMCYMCLNTKTAIVPFARTSKLTNNPELREYLTWRHRDIESRSMSHQVPSTLASK